MVHGGGVHHNVFPRKTHGHQTTGAPPAGQRPRLGHALEVFHDLNLDRMVECFGLYLANGKLDISRTEAERRMFAKYASPTFLTDMRVRYCLRPMPRRTLMRPQRNGFLKRYFLKSLPAHPANLGLGVRK